MNKVDKPLPNKLIKDRPLKRYLLERLGVKRPGRFKRIGAGTYCAAANYVMRQVDLLKHMDEIVPTRRNQASRLLINANAVEQLHVYNRQRIDPDKDVITAPPSLARNINSLFVDWLEGEIHSHPSVGQTFEIRS